MTHGSGDVMHSSIVETALVGKVGMGPARSVKDM
jgi:hypothetical protein